LFGTIHGAQLNAMKLALIVLCVGSVAFLSRVLAALLKELRSQVYSVGRGRHSEFRPRGKRAGLVVMQSVTETSRSKTKAG
jgi:hypothetical protein